MPVDHGRFRQRVLQPDLEDVPDPCLQHRSGYLAVVPPGSRRSTRNEFPRDLTRLQLSGDDASTRLRLRGFVRPVIGAEGLLRGCVARRPAVVVSGVGVALHVM